MGGSEKWCKYNMGHGYDLGARTTLKERIEYNQHLSLIQRLPTSSA